MYLAGGDRECETGVAPHEPGVRFEPERVRFGFDSVEAENERRQLDPKNLSRTLEDAGTLTSVLVPWNTCGAFMAQTLGVPTLTYAPFAVFNVVNPLVAAVYGFAQIGIARLESDEPSPERTPGGASVKAEVS